MSPGTVFVTGAAGFIGGALGRRYQADGWLVRGVDRRTDGVPDGAEVVVGDISEPGDWQAHVEGADVVVHTAALVSNTARLDEAWRANVCGTRQVVDAASHAGVRRLVHVSSVAVYSHHRIGQVDEHQPVRPTGDVYGDTKIAAEQVVLQAHGAGEVGATVVRPGDVYGPESRPWTILPVQMLKAGQVVLPANGRGVFIPIYVDDLVDAIVRVAEVEGAAGHVFNVTGGQPIETRHFFGHYSRMLGHGAPRVAPTAVAVAIARVLGGALRLAGRPSEANAATMRMLSATGDVSIDKARRMLDWAPAVDIDEGMRRTEAWLRDSGYL